MRSDLKIGMLIGVALAMGATLFVSTRPGSSIEGRLKKVSVRNHTNVNNQLIPNNNQSVPDKDTDIFNQSGRDKDAVADENRIEYDEQLLLQMLGQADQAIQQGRQDNTRGNGIGGNAADGACRIHIVLKGETLTYISHLYYGSSAYWQRIFRANSQTITDPDRLTPGTRLVLPE